MNKKELIGFIGLLNRGGKLLFGEASYHSPKTKLLLLATDCSSNTRKKALSYASKFNIEVLEAFSKAKLGEALGYEEISLLGITDKKSSLALKKKMDLKGDKNEQKEQLPIKEK